MSIMIHLASVRAPDDASADIGSPSRCGALNLNGTNAVAVLRIATGRIVIEPYNSLPACMIANAIGRIGAALDCTDTAAAARSPMVSPANEQPRGAKGARVILQPQTDERARARLAALLVLLSIALSRGEGIAWQ